MRGPKITQRTSVKTWVRGAITGGAIALAAVAAVMTTQENEAVAGKISQERQAQVMLQSREVVWARPSAADPYREKRQQWDKRILELRRTKQTSHPDLETAGKLVPLYLRAEDVSRRIDLISDNQPDLRKRLVQEFSGIEQDLNRIENRTD